MSDSICTIKFKARNCEIRNTAANEIIYETAGELLELLLTTTTHGVITWTVDNDSVSASFDMANTSVTKKTFKSAVNELKDDDMIDCEMTFSACMPSSAELAASNNSHDSVFTRFVKWVRGWF